MGSKLGSSLSKETLQMASSIPTLTCPYCRTVFYGVTVQRHGLMACGSCGKAIRV